MTRTQSEGMNYADRLTAISDFLEWLCDNGVVMSVRVESTWVPISETQGAGLAEKFLRELTR